MSNLDKFAIRLTVAFAVLAILALFIGLAKGIVKGNMKIEMTEDRVVVSCVDGLDPIVKMVPRPRGGHYVVVVCEKTNDR